MLVHLECNEHFGALIQLRWRTWAITEQQGVSWLRDCQLNNIGFQAVSLGPCVRQASMAFWAQKPAVRLGRPQSKYTAPHEDYVL